MWNLQSCVKTITMNSCLQHWVTDSYITGRKLTFLLSKGRGGNIIIILSSSFDNEVSFESLNQLSPSVLSDQTQQFLFLISAPLYVLDVCLPPYNVCHQVETTHVELCGIMKHMYGIMWNYVE